MNASPSGGPSWSYGGSGTGLWCISNWPDTASFSSTSTACVEGCELICSKFNNGASTPTIYYSCTLSDCTTLPTREQPAGHNYCSTVYPSSGNSRYAFCDMRYSGSATKCPRGWAKDTGSNRYYCSRGRLMERTTTNTSNTWIGSQTNYYLFYLIENLRHYHYPYSTETNLSVGGTSDTVNQSAYYRLIWLNPTTASGLYTISTWPIEDVLEWTGILCKETCGYYYSKVIMSSSTKYRIALRNCNWKSLTDTTTYEGVIYSPCPSLVSTGSSDIRQAYCTNNNPDASKKCPKGWVLQSVNPDSYCDDGSHYEKTTYTLANTWLGSVR